jgi:DNA-binding NtrC family response regulator
MAAPIRQLLTCIQDPGFTLSLRSALQEQRYEAISCDNRLQVSERAANAGVSAVLIEISTLDPEAIAFIGACRGQRTNLPVVAIFSDSEQCRIARNGRPGAFECLHLQSTPGEIAHVLELVASQVTRNETAQKPDMPWRRQLVGQSLPMVQIARLIRLVAPRRCTVLISGETGTGKEVAARCIHLASNRAHKPMVSINCGAIPENLIEAELFGHVKGAFTGAINARIGRFEQAQGGTLFLDEIGDLPFDLQAKLLRVLQEREIQRLGSTETVKVDVRVIAATNADLASLVREGRFREDLYYRLNVVPMHMPALRDRLADINALTSHFVHKICQAESLPLKQITPEVVEMLSRYSWPGNIRQLENVVEHAVVLSEDREQLYPFDFVLPRPAASAALDPIAIPTGSVPAEGLDYTEALRQFELAILQQAMSRAQGNKTAAADLLKLPRTTLLHKLRTLQCAAA